MTDTENGCDVVRKSFQQRRPVRHGSSSVNRGPERKTSAVLGDNSIIRVDLHGIILDSDCFGDRFCSAISGHRSLRDSG